MTIEALLGVVPPPVAPFEAYDGPWEPIEAELGTPLPQDYKDFVRLYGYGYFMEFMGICVPRASNANIRLEHHVPLVSSIFADEEVHPDFPFVMWPHRQGLLPFGSTDNADNLFWRRVGPPESWSIVVCDRGLGECEIFECDLTGFLAGLATGEIAPKELPDLLPCDQIFKPGSAV